jgi:hypothetical protein
MPHLRSQIHSPIEKKTQPSYIQSSTTPKDSPSKTNPSPLSPPSKPHPKILRNKTNSDILSIHYKPKSINSKKCANNFMTSPFNKIIKMNLIETQWSESNKKSITSWSSFKTIKSKSFATKLPPDPVMKTENLPPFHNSPITVKKPDKLTF